MSKFVNAMVGAKIPFIDSRIKNFLPGQLMKDILRKIHVDPLKKLNIREKKEKALLPLN